MKAKGDRAFIGIDWGSTSIKLVALSLSLDTLYSATSKVTSDTDGDKAEQDGEELISITKALISKALNYAKKNNIELKGFGFSVQRSAVLAWNIKSGKPLSSVITWRDKRAKKEVEQIDKAKKAVLNSSGLPLTYHYAAPKIATMQQYFSGKSCTVSTLDTYLLAILGDTERPVTDDSMAARTLLYNIHRKTWDEDLCKLFAVKKALLPSIRPSLSFYGKIEDIPILSCMGDQNAALYAVYPAPLLNIGTVASFMFPLSQIPPKPQGYLSSIAFSKADARTNYTYMIEATQNYSGTILDQLKRLFGLKDLYDINQIINYKDIESDLLKTVAYKEFGSTGSPEWKDATLDLIHNDNLNCTDYAAALIEQIANKAYFQFQEIRSNHPLPSVPYIAIAGGGSRIDYLGEYLSNLIGRSVRRPNNHDLSAIGAAMAAMEASGKKIKREQLKCKEFTPLHPNPTTKRYKEWLRLREISLKESRWGN